MKSVKWALLYGFLVWLILFVVAVGVFRLKSFFPPFFETIMAVVVTLSAVVFGNLYFRRVEAGFLKEGVLLGLLWFVMNVGIDLPLFQYGPMKMSLAHYFMDIGLTYLIFPAVTIGMGCLLQSRR